MAERAVVILNLNEVFTVDARMPWIATLTRWFFGNAPARTASRSRRSARPRQSLRPLEGLERREVLSAGNFAPIASIPGTVTPGSTTSVVVNFSAGQITPTHSGAVYLAIDAKAAPGSSAAPKVADVVGPSGLISYSIDKTKTAEYIIKLYPNPNKPIKLTVDLTAQSQTAGGVIVDTYLPGDVNGDGVVDSADTTRIKAAYGKSAGQSGYDQYADINQDGKVGCFDLTLERANLGGRAATVPEYVAPTPTPTPTPTTTTAAVAVAITPVTAVPVATTAVVTTPTTVTAAAVPATAVTSAPVVYYQPTQAYPYMSTMTPYATQSTAGQPIYLVPATGTATATGTTTQTPYYVPASQPTYYSTVQPTSVAIPSTQAAYYIPTTQTVASGTSTAPVYVYGQPTVQGPTTGLAQVA